MNSRFDMVQYSLFTWDYLHYRKDMIGRSVTNPDSKVHGANMGPTWVLSAPDGPHVGLMNLAIRENMSQHVVD